MDRTAADPLIGRVLDGRYRVGPKVARGGMATVYEAIDLRLESRQRRTRVRDPILSHCLLCRSDERVQAVCGLDRVDECEQRREKFRCRRRRRLDHRQQSGRGCERELIVAFA